LFADPTWVAQACVVIVELHDWLFPGAGTSRTLQKAMLREDRELLISGENLVWVRSAAMLQPASWDAALRGGLKRPPG